MLNVVLCFFKYIVVWLIYLLGLNIPFAGCNFILALYLVDTMLFAHFFAGYNVVLALCLFGHFAYWVQLSADVHCFFFLIHCLLSNSICWIQSCLALCARYNAVWAGIMSRYSYLLETML